MKDCMHVWIPLYERSRLIKILDKILGLQQQPNEFYCKHCYTVGSLDGFPIEYSTYKDIMPVRNQEYYRDDIARVKP